MLNYAKRRSLSGQRAFLQVGEHAPDRGGELALHLVPVAYVFFFILAQQRKNTKKARSHVENPLKTVILSPVFYIV